MTHRTTTLLVAGAAAVGGYLYWRSRQVRLLAPEPTAFSAADIALGKQLELEELAGELE